MDPLPPFSGKLLLRGDDGQLYHVTLDRVERVPVGTTDPDATLQVDVDRAYEEIKKLIPGACSFLIKRPPSAQGDEG